MKHPNIVRFIDTFETSTQLVIVLEYIAGGELFDYIVEGKCTANGVREMFHELASGA